MCNASIRVCLIWCPTRVHIGPFAVCVFLKCYNYAEDLVRLYSASNYRNKTKLKGQCWYDNKCEEDYYSIAPSSNLRDCDQLASGKIAISYPPDPS